MNKSFLFWISTILIFVNVLFAQTDSTSSNYRFGIGATLEKEYGVSTTRYSSPTVGIMKVYIPIYYKNLFKIVSEFGYWNYKIAYSDEEYSNTVYHFGININYVFEYDNTFFYLGPRFAIDHVILPYYGYDDEFKDSRNDYIYGLNVGSEYFLSNHFSLGIDIQFNFFSFGDEIENYTVDQKVSALESVVFLCFYF